MNSGLIDWHLTKQGDQAKPGILFLHGFMGTGKIWKPIMEQLQDEYYCVAVDLPGHGQTETDLDNLNFDITAEGLIRLCSKEFNRPPIICGYSLGGRIALYTALHHPDSFRAMIIESASPGIENEREQKKRFLTDSDWAQKLNRSTMREFLVEWYAQPVFSYLSDERIAKIIEKKSSGDPIKMAKAMMIYSQGRQKPMWHKLSGWEKQALIVVGESDLKYCRIAKRVSGLLPACELRLIPDAGHIVHLENRNRFIEALKSWLDSRIV